MITTKRQLFAKKKLTNVLRELTYFSNEMNIFTDAERNELVRIINNAHTRIQNNVIGTSEVDIYERNIKIEKILKE